ncbi:hypothetical protein OA010_04080 [Luminiphilus sp.]|nr:hypothetical protein [Luminiphilus sp.]
MRSLAILTLSMMVALTAFGDDITVTDFTSGTTISSSDMNSNFDVVVAESNENDGRIATNASQISSLSARLDGATYTWLGYTTNSFTPLSQSKAIGPNLSMFCKTEFSDSKASVADLDILEDLIRGGSVPPPASTALVLYSHGFMLSDNYAYHPFWGDTYLNGPGSVCSINETDQGYFSIGCTGSATGGTGRLVACVTQN